MTPRRRKLRIIHFRRGGENLFAPLLLLSHLNPLTLGFKWVPGGSPPYPHDSIVVSVSAILSLRASAHTGAAIRFLS